MDRTFQYTFVGPPAQNPVPGGAATAALSVQEVEDAGIREVLQTPGAALGSWAVLDALLQPTGANTPFTFLEPLGKAREVKVALSGLFGRFVARAFLERYCNLSVFAHLTSGAMTLQRRRRIYVQKKHGERGDNPDWIACTAALNGVTVAEAKGSHERGGPAQTLERAWQQANRVEVSSGGRPVIPLKRIAVVARWGSAQHPATEPMLSVRDPDEEGEPTPPDEMGALCLSVLRLHFADLLAPLGQAAVAQSLRDLAASSSEVGERAALARARSALRDAEVREVGGTDEAIGGLIGGVVTRAGPTSSPSLSTGDQETLARLDLRPKFVGVELEILTSAVEGDVEVLRKRSAAGQSRDRVARSDRVGSWIVPLGPDLRTLKSSS